MRIFSNISIISFLKKSGFVDITFYEINEDMKKYGIFWANKCSLIISATKIKELLNKNLIIMIHYSLLCNINIISSHSYSFSINIFFFKLIQIFNRIFSFISIFKRLCKVKINYFKFYIPMFIHSI